MHFDYTLKRWLQFDRLKVYYRKSKTQSWILIIDLPVSRTGVGYRWGKYNLELPADSYTGEAQIGFQYDDGNDLGFGAAIDNVLIDEQEVTGILTHPDVIALRIYPNPAGDEANLEISGTPQGPVNLKMISTDGKVLWTKIRRDQPGEPRVW